MPESLRYMLLQIRNPDDPMQGQEVDCFSRVLACPRDHIEPFDLLTDVPSAAELARNDVVLIGGSGDYSVTSTEPWIEPILDSLRELHANSKPTFASCWGFQAMGRAMGGTVEKDLEHAEVGTHWLKLTDVGRDDPVFGPLGEMFGGQMGHEDRVVVLPEDAVLLASSDLVENQAYYFKDKPIYCTQFHPEVNIEALLQRLEQYPEYIVRIAGLSPDRFSELISETPETELLLPRFVRHVFG